MHLITLDRIIMEQLLVNFIIRCIESIKYKTQIIDDVTK